MLSLPYLGAIDPANLAERYTASALVEGRTVALDLNLPSRQFGPNAAQAVAQFLADLTGHAAAATRFIEAELANEADGTVRDFLTFHLEELEPETLASLLQSGSEVAPERQLLAKLVVERIGLYPESEPAFAVLDFTFEGNAMVNGRRAITDQIIAVYLDARGHFSHLSHES